MNVNNLLQDIHTDYLLVCPTQITATGLSMFTTHEVCYDKFIRLLSSESAHLFHPGWYAINISLHALVLVFVCKRIIIIMAGGKILALLVAKRLLVRRATKCAKMWACIFFFFSALAKKTKFTFCAVGACRDKLRFPVCCVRLL